MKQTLCVNKSFLFCDMVVLVHIIFPIVELFLSFAIDQTIGLLQSGRGEMNWIW